MGMRKSVQVAEHKDLRMIDWTKIVEHIEIEVQICSTCDWGDKELLELESGPQSQLQTEEEAYSEICPVCQSPTIWIAIRTSV